MIKDRIFQYERMASASFASSSSKVYALLKFIQESIFLFSMYSESRSACTREVSLPRSRAATRVSNLPTHRISLAMRVRARASERASERELRLE